MPTISAFYGIIIKMNVRGEHNPPHIHAEYGEHAATFGLDGEIMRGSMPPGKAKLIAAWIEIHKDELMANWKLAINKELPYKIEPLK